MGSSVSGCSGLIPPNDTDDVRQAIDAGAVVNIGLTAEDLKKTNEEFVKFLGSLDGRPAGLMPDGDPISSVHEDKVDARLRPLMRSLCAKVREDEWLELPSEIANGYMFFLAEVVGRRRDLPRLTDDPDVFSIMQYYACDGQVSEYVYDREAAESSSALTMQILIPSGVAQAPLEALLKFRSDFEEGRHLFRKTVAQLAIELSRIEDASFAADRIKLYIDSVREAQGLCVRNLRRFGENLSSVLFSVAVPTAFGAFSLLAAGTPHDPFNGINLGGSAVFGAIAALGQARSDYRRQWGLSNGSYLLGLEAKFGSERRYSVPDFASRMEQFVND